ncbi:MAG: ribonuclease H-like domain-containing protein [Methanobrevibacter sp.]|uniref:ribonuclease H-like domain-containing protein n=1 Tax=Methanobrevibacter sp. TaxID=66852 RepID=UPI0026E0CA1D|nr:ribonuclease H-like domain-containing protein [Methanobrevibacter sp.]MDO5849200.1 ribonuclease H-like domain-containing protein [Methanobrevibacter sp.]
MSRQEHEDYLFKAIIGEDGNEEKLFDSPFEDEFLYFKQYKNALLNKYENYSFEDFKGSKIENNDFGEVLKITTEEPFDFKLKDNDYKESLKGNLKLIPGIGPAKEMRLREKGYYNLKDLASHDAYSRKALKAIENIDNFETGDLINLAKKNCYDKDSKKEIINSASLFDAKDFKFMDIETLGLSNVPIILLGVAEIKKDRIVSTQYLLRTIEEEAAVLEAYKSHLDEYSAHVTFNGKYFDVPFIRNRLNYYRLSDDELNIPHFDLLYYARQLWKNKLPNCQLQTIEKHVFGIERTGDVPGQHIPDYYNTYLKENNIGPLVPIVEHNRQDIVSLASFLMKMYDEVNGD